MFSVKRIEATEFAARVVPALAEREVENNLMIGLALRVAKDPQATPGAVLCTVEAHGELVGAALRTPPQLVVVTRLPAGAAHAVAEFFRTLGDVPDGAVGPENHGRDLASAFAALSGGRLEHASDEIIYELVALHEPVAPPGFARRATSADAPLVTRFMSEFFREVVLPHPPNPAELTGRLLARNSAWLWEDERPRAIACWARHMTTGTAIAPVYTSPDSRARGYGSAVTAALCRALFAEGRAFVCLHAERANPTSNHVYRKLGFREASTINVWTVRA
jgi:ribosomal protein S18 acetylase RimI-like enzyme